MDATQPRRRRRKNITTTELPLDVIFNNILPRLPARYVKKYLCVSKEWNSFLKSSMFANLHLNHATNDDHQNHHKLLVIYEKGTTRSYSNRDFETQKPGMRRRRPLPFGYSSRQIWITSSCNGLVLVALMNFGSELLSDLIIWNPLTNDYKTLSKIDLNIVYCGTTLDLYYNSSEQDYRVVLITAEKAVYIYSLKSDSWRKIKLEFIIPKIPLSTCWNENLYFKKLFPNSIITMFDTKTEKLTSISTPRLQFQFKWCSNVIVQRGCIYICQGYNSSKPFILLWSLDRTAGVWVQAPTYTRMQDIYDVSMEPLHLMRDGNWLMESDDMRNYYFKVDLEKKHNKGGTPFYTHGLVAGVYIETFVSPNQYTN